ncbi:MAG: HdeD family acid-resistance protein [Pseudomonadota bacterium]
MSQPQKPDLEAMRSKMEEAFRENWKSFVLQGVILFLLGLIAVAVPAASTIAIELLLGWLILFGGLIAGYRALKSSESTARWSGLLGGLISVIAGVLLLVYPLQGVITLTLLVTAFLVAEGFSQMVLAWKLKPAKPWGWVFFSGIMALVLAGLVWSQFPGSASWLLGLMVGLNLMFAGSSLAATALSFRS